nr:7332_t:CDS:2 [Entrophospora candida]
MTTEKCLYNKNKASKTAVTNKQKLQQIELVFDVKYAIDTLMKLPDPVPKNTNIASYQYPILVSFQAAKYHVLNLHNPIDWDIVDTSSQPINCKIPSSLDDDRKLNQKELE